ncbi:PIN domain-containing protein [Candidatus Poriferisodalis sp.]|uniref:PIN domain-containing protein n=1 Tax=Candidatus Poriferisodalis sp. TaxID=3101277 RepID=UPI003C6F5E4E
MPVFVDTNVLVYARDASEPDKQALARVWMSALWASREGRLSTQVLNEYYVTVTRKLTPAMPAPQARADVRDLCAWQPTVIDAHVLAQAWEVEERFGLSYWDALIVAAAQTANCDHLLTEDVSDGQQLGSVRVVNPFAHTPDSLL